VLDQALASFEQGDSDVTKRNNPKQIKLSRLHCFGLSEKIIVEKGEKLKGILPLR